MSREFNYEVSIPYGEDVVLNHLEQKLLKLYYEPFHLQNRYIDTPLLQFGFDIHVLYPETFDEKKGTTIIGYLDLAFDTMTMESYQYERFVNYYQNSDNELGQLWQKISLHYQLNKNTEHKENRSIKAKV